MLIDLLGFTIILPLFPSLFEYYEKSENDTLYRYVHSSVESFRNWLNVPSSEQHVTTVLFGGLLGSLFSFLQAGGCLFLGHNSVAFLKSSPESQFLMFYDKKK